MPERPNGAHWKCDGLLILGTWVQIPHLLPKKTHMLRNFEIDPQYLTDVHQVHALDLVKDRNNPTPDEIIMILRGNDIVRSIYTTDHPEFTKLRDELEKLRYIKTQRGWWNGDIVLKSFKINGWILKKDYTFPCAAALSNAIKCKAKSTSRSKCINW